MSIRFYEASSFTYHNHCDEELVRSEPFLEDDKAKQNLVIVISTGGMFLEKVLHCSLAQVLIDSRFTIQQDLCHSIVHLATEPIINHIHSEPSLCSFEDLAREIRLTHLAM